MAAMTTSPWLTCCEPPAWSRRSPDFREHGAARRDGHASRSLSVRGCRRADAARPIEVDWSGRGPRRGLATRRGGPDGAGQWRAQWPRMAVGTGGQVRDRAVGTGDRRCRSEAADQEGGGADGRGHRPAAPASHGDRRYLLSRGLDPDDLAPEPARLDALTRAAAVAAIPFPRGLAPRPLPVDPPPSPADRLPGADIVVITWTVDELAGLARIPIPGVAPARWQRYSRGFYTYRPQIRPTAPAATRNGWATTNSPRSGRLACCA